MQRTQKTLSVDVLTTRSCSLVTCDAVLSGELILQRALSSWRGRHYNPHNISNHSPSVKASHPRDHNPQHACCVDQNCP